MFQEMRPPEALPWNDSFFSLPEIQRTIFKSLLRTLTFFKVNVGNHRLLYVLVEIGLLFCYTYSLKNVGNYRVTLRS